MADNVQAYLDQLEEEYNRPLRIRNLMPKPSGGLSVTVSLADGQGNPVNAGPINFTVTFNKVVTGFTNADVSFTGSTVGGTLAAAVTGTGPSYNVAVTGMTGNGLVAVSIPAGAAQDATGTLTPASTAVFVTFDTAAPSVTINQAVGQSDPAAATPINFTAVFSEAVTGFDATDVAITGTAGGTKVVTLSGGPTYNVAVTGMTTAGTVIASIAAGVCTDAAGNANTISTSTDNTVTWSPDVTAPTVTVNQAGGQSDPATVSPINFTAVFSEAVTGFVDADVTITGTAGGTKVASVTGGPSTYNIAISGMTTSGTVIASIAAGVCTDLAGNPNTISTSTDNTVTWNADTTAPTVTINKGASQPDPTSASPILFDVVFSEVVTGFTAADISFTGSTTGGTLAAAISGTGPTYTVSVTGMAAPDGNVVASIPAASVIDLAGILNTASTSTDNIVAWTAVASTNVQTYFFETGQY